MNMVAEFIKPERKLLMEIIRGQITKNINQNECSKEKTIERLLKTLASLHEDFPILRLLNDNQRQSLNKQVQNEKQI